jgi:hypothetical protein
MHHELRVPGACNVYQVSVKMTRRPARLCGVVDAPWPLLAMMRDAQLESGEQRQQSSSSGLSMCFAHDSYRLRL